MISHGRSPVEHGAVGQPVHGQIGALIGVGRRQFLVDVLGIVQSNGASGSAIGSQA